MSELDRLEHQLQRLDCCLADTALALVAAEQVVDEREVTKLLWRHGITKRIRRELYGWADAARSR